MDAISLEYDVERETLVLRDVSASVARHPLFAAYFRQVGGSIRDDAALTLPTPPDALSARYQTVAKLLARIGAAVETHGHVSDALEQVQSDERRFAQFSRDAESIWLGRFDAEAFRQFVAIVEQACPGRVFYRKQLLSAFHLAFAQNACNFSVPGAGKTSIVYAAFAYLRSLPQADERAISRLLIVGPLSSFKAWEDEYAEIFLRPAIAKRISGAVPVSERADYLRGVALGARDVTLTLTSYPTLANLEEEFRVFLRRPGSRVMMVMDEAHYIKSADGSQAAASLRLAPLASSRIILTGTPAPNGYEDLSNLFKFIYPSRNIVGFPAASLRAMTDGAMPSAIPELKSRIRPFYTRIRKSDLGLPDVREERIPVPMSEVQEEIYRALERRILPQLRHDLESAAAPVRVRARLIRLRQACVNPELLLRPLEEEGVFDTGGTGDFTTGELKIADLVRAFNPATDLERLQHCKALVERILQDQGKVLIWSYFLGNLTKLKETFSGAAEFVEVLTGATPVAGSDDDEAAALVTREAIIDRFHRASGRAILIANPQAVGESISLHKACRTAIYFDRDFNAGRFIQSKDRIHRYNPKGGGPVKYLYLVSPGTVDSDIDGRLTIKERRLSDLVESEEIPLLTASSDLEGSEDVRAILEAYERRKTL